MSHAPDLDDPLLIIHLVDNSMVAYAQAPIAPCPCDLPCPRWPRSFSKALDLRNDAFANYFGEAIEVPLRGTLNQQLMHASCDSLSSPPTS